MSSAPAKSVSMPVSHSPERRYCIRMSRFRVSLGRLRVACF